MDDLSLSLAEVSDERIISTNSIIFYSRPNVGRVWLLRGCLFVWFDTQCHCVHTRGVYPIMNRKSFIRILL